jgi:hypothetical protein
VAWALHGIILEVKMQAIPVKARFIQGRDFQFVQQQFAQMRQRFNQRPRGALGFGVAMIG